MNIGACSGLIATVSFDLFIISQYGVWVANIGLLLP
jgi:hypothetical protein